MKFVYHKQASLGSIVLDKQAFSHLFTVRRLDKKKSTDTPIYFRNLLDDNIYSYIIKSIEKKSAILNLVDTKCVPQKPSQQLHIGWCIIDVREIEKSICILNEIGVSKISFIYCKRSQKKYLLNKKRLNSILINSCEQCGRSNFMQLEELDSIEEFRSKYTNAKMLHFSKNTIESDMQIDCVLIGPEGGWCDDEVSLYKDSIIGIKPQNTLKSSSMAVAIASKLLL